MYKHNEEQSQSNDKSAPDHKAPVVIPGSPLVKHYDLQPSSGWAELPGRCDGDFLKYKTYYTTLCDGQRVRNYSICYHTGKMVSLWVAYPLHEVYTTPKIDRTDAWAFDDAVTAYGEGG